MVSVSMSVTMRIAPAMSEMPRARRALVSSAAREPAAVSGVGPALLRGMTVLLVRAAHLAVFDPYADRCRTDSARHPG